MNAVVLLISIEDCPSLPPLPGCNADAQAFLDTIRSFATVEDLLWCASPRTPESTHDATLPGILAALAGRLAGPTGWVGAGVERLFAFVSGHGVVTLGDGEGAQALATADRRAEGDGALLAIGDLPRRLATTLGPGLHHWFFDVCRVDSEEGAPALPGIFPRHPSRTAGTSEVWSATERAAAAARSGFGPAVVEGLQGEARVWTTEADRAQRKLVVTRLSLADHVREVVHRRYPEQDVFDAAAGVAERIRLFDPPPTLRFEVRGPPGQPFSVRLRPGRGTPPVLVAGTGVAVVDLPPDDYEIEPDSPDLGVDEERVDLLGLAPRPVVHLVRRALPATGFPVRAVRALRVPDLFARARRSPLGARWLDATLLTEMAVPHLSESLHGIPIDPGESDDGVLLSAVAAVLGAGFHVLDRGRFPPPAAGPGVYVVLSARGVSRGGCQATLVSPDGLRTLARTTLRDAGGLAPSGFLPAPAPVEGFARLCLRTGDGYERVVLVPMGEGCVTVVLNIDHPLQADQRFAMVPRGGAAPDGMRLAGVQVLAQAGARDGVVEGGQLPAFTVPFGAFPGAGRVAAVYGALVKAAERMGVGSADGAPYAEPAPVWLSAGWEALVASNDPRTAPFQGLGVRLQRSPLTTWRVRRAGG